jgi:hypothetical protein
MKGGDTQRWAEREDNGNNAPEVGDALIGEGPVEVPEGKLLLDKATGLEGLRGCKESEGERERER